MTDTAPELLIDGKEDGALSARDRGLAFGDGVFETMAVVNGSVRFAGRHLARLADGCERLGFEAPPEDTLQADIARVAAGQQQTVVKLIVTRGTGGVGYAPPADARPVRIVQRLDWPNRAPSDYADGLRVGLCRCRVSRQPALAGLKHLNRLEQVLARAEMARLGLAEGLMLDDRDHVIEATAGNVFASINGELVTPRLDLSGVRGVMRAVVLATARDLGIAVRRSRLELPALLEAKEVFLTNALAGLLPVREVVAGSFSTSWAPGPMAAALSRALIKEGVKPCGPEGGVA
ncbi:MAG: aminodeoxychorismate lyase [Pseudomonadota bacterium]